MNQRLTPGDRLATPDILKVVSIFAVVFIHGFTLFPFSPSTVDFNHSQIGLAASMSRFCVPVFIFLWAYFMEKSILKRGTGIVMERFYKLLLPFVFWTLIYCLIKADVKQMSLPYIFVKYWTGYGWSGQYYFIILFQFIALFPLWRWISEKLMKLSSAVFILSFIFFIFIAYSGWSEIRIIVRISDRIFIYWWPYVILGIIHARKNIFNIKIPAMLKIAALVLIPLENYWLQPASISAYALPSIFIASMLLISLIESKLSYTSLPAGLGKTIGTLANYTLGIFCLNPLIILILNHYFSFSTSHFPGASILLPLLSTMIVFGVCTLAIIVLKRVKLGFLVST